MRGLAWLNSRSPMTMSYPGWGRQVIGATGVDLGAFLVMNPEARPDRDVRKC